MVKLKYCHKKCASQRIECCVITEDISSEFCVDYILSHFLPEIHARIMVVAMTGCDPQAKSGASAVSALLEASRHANKKPIKFIGVFDNDQEFEATFTDRRIEMTRKMILSNKEPFDQILTNVARLNIDRIEEKLTGFSALFFEHEGLNYHDHLIKVAQLMAVDVRLIWRFCLDIWIASNREDCEKLAKQIENLTLV